MKCLLLSLQNLYILLLDFPQNVKLFIQVHSTFLGVDRKKMIISFCTLAWFLYISWCTEENVLVFSFQNCIAKRSFLKLSKQNITSSGKLQYKNSFSLYQICRLEKNWNTSDRVYNLINCAYFSKKRLLNCKTRISVQLLGTFFFGFEVRYYEIYIRVKNATLGNDTWL